MEDTKTIIKIFDENNNNMDIIKIIILSIIILLCDIDDANNIHNKFITDTMIMNKINFIFVIWVLINMAMF